MTNREADETFEVTIPVREGRYEYVLVRRDGTSTTIPVTEAAYEAGRVPVAVRDGEKVMEIALASTSDPDLAAPRGQLWPEDGE